LLDLAPLELDCMNTLWPLGEGTVREIRDRLAPRRPRAYTTIMTIMDRLARKGVVERRKSGRAYIYRPNLSAEDAQRQALGQVIENFFGGSHEAVAAYLRSVSDAGAASAVQLEQPVTERAFVAKAAVAAAGGSSQRAEFSRPDAQRITGATASAAAPAPREEPAEEDEPASIDETLL
jgi:BlaI family transcriptional regulator, penicillinase repressor